MSYNWASASTPAGRERLKELLDRGFEVIGRGISNRVNTQNPAMSAFKKEDEGYRIYLWKKNFDDFYLDGIEFLDPEPSKPQTDENGLLPCPFCGCAKYIECGNMYGDPRYKFIVTCQHCGAKSCDAETKDEAIEAWNKRA